MTNIFSTLQNQVSQGIQAVYDASFPSENVLINTTRKDFEGEYTVVTFPMAKGLRQKRPKLVKNLEFGWSIM